MQGQYETELTPLGESQAIALGKKLKDVEFGAVYSSPLKRTMRTTELILGKRELPIIQDDALKEIHMGDWQGILIDDLKKDFPEETVLLAGRMNR